jgi:hypothetical protein
MVSSPTPLRLRPLPLSELLDELFRMYRRNFVLMGSAALALAVPGLVLNLLAGQYKTFGFFFNAFANVNNPGRLDTIGPPQANVIYVILGYVVVVLLLPVSAGLLVRITTDVAMGRPTTLLGAIQRTMSRYLGLAGFILLVSTAGLGVGVVLVLVFSAAIALGASGNANGGVIAILILFGLVMLGAAFLLAIWLGIRLVVAIPAMLEERIGPIAGIRRSWHLVRGNFWRVIGILLVVYVLTAVVQYALAGALGLVAFFVPGLSGDARGGLLLVLLTLVQVVVTPILAIAISLIYFDLRVRKEALDLDQLALAASPLPPPVAPPRA